MTYPPDTVVGALYYEDQEQQETIDELAKLQEKIVQMYNKEL